MTGGTVGGIDTTSEFDPANTGGTMTVKADKSFDRRDGARIGVDFADASVHVFNRDSGDRIR